MSGAEPAFRVLKLRRRDVTRCAELERLIFPGDDPWSREAFVSEIDQGHYYLGAYGPDEALLGYAGLAVNRGAHPEAEVHTIGVDPDHQGLGIGTALLRALLARADERRATTFLEVRTDNESAIALYRAHGFEVVGLRKRYYQPSGADAHTMRRTARTADAEEVR
ncbi:ribosomal protein S18-alanine N-acetyltransferase [Saccharopolyspora sp. HNM0983]|uniref:Ribosomal protein S18-alanine N-acetyltransferase n=1 Tax=Saccharopolyspora montiporae TaxID=2781240 RepID=A0A929FZZ3_9PSEU|nr:ribosomal protein S18-alanine N-acetyltransferase [Saccharopolyspora sp. HNM0983]MBE9375050.1 ribosomal protein S18-alanine N-acetyltransferase [Saccharopolyspora sp. HNM0983]